MTCLEKPATIYSKMQWEGLQEKPDSGEKDQWSVTAGIPWAIKAFFILNELSCKTT